MHVDDKELDIIKETGCTVVHNPQSNMNNGYVIVVMVMMMVMYSVGIPRIVKMLGMGIPACLGTGKLTIIFQLSIRWHHIRHDC